MSLFQKMVLNTISKQVGDETQAFVDEICAEMGITFDHLRPDHMKRFSDILYRKAEPKVGPINAKALAGIVSHFEKSRLA